MRGCFFDVQRLFERPWLLGAQWLFGVQWLFDVQWLLDVQRLFGLLWLSSAQGLFGVQRLFGPCGWFSSKVLHRLRDLPAVEVCRVFACVEGFLLSLRGGPACDQREEC